MTKTASEFDQHSAPLLDAGRIQLDFSNNDLFVDSKVVSLRGKPLALLNVLMESDGQVVTKDQLLEKVWDGRPHSDAVLTTAIKEIRQALGDDARSQWAVATVYGKGYRFMLPVTRREKFLPSLPTTNKRDDTRRRWAMPLAAVLLVVMALVIWFSAHRTEAPIDSIAVLPFDDMTSSAQYGWFASGMVEELLDSLAAIDELQVAARNSTRRLSTRNHSISDIGSALGVTHVLEGSIRDGTDGRIRLTVQLIRTTDGMHEWSQAWDRNLSYSDALDIQRDVSQLVADMMQNDAAVIGNTKEPLPDDVWEALLKGRELVEQRSPTSVNAGLALLQQTLERAPHHPDIHAALGLAYILAAETQEMPMQEALKSARAHVNRALENQPDSAESLVAASLLAMADRDAEASLRFADRAVKSRKGFAKAHHRRGIALMSLGRLEESYQALSKARSLDPLEPIILAGFSVIAQNTGRIKHAFEAAEENFKWNPDNLMARFSLGDFYLRFGRYQQALPCLKAALTDGRGSTLAARRLSELYWRIGAIGHIESMAPVVAVWPARAAHLLQTGAIEAALADSPSEPRMSVLGISGLSIQRWSRAIGDPLPWAHNFIQGIGGVDRLTASTALPDNLVPAYLVLSANHANEAEAFSKLLQRTYADAIPADFDVFGDLLSALMWHAHREEYDRAIGYLERLNNLGFILPELGFDPVFDRLRELPAAVTIATSMQERAKVLRDSLALNPTCGT